VVFFDERQNVVIHRLSHGPFVAFATFANLAQCEHTTVGIGGVYDQSADGAPVPLR